MKIYAVRIGTFDALMKIVKKLAKGKLSKPNFVFQLEPLVGFEPVILSMGGRLKTRGVVLDDDKTGITDELHRLTILWDPEATPVTRGRKSR